MRNGAFLMGAAPLALAFAGFAASSAPPARAAESPRGMEIEEVVVTARRREEGAQSVPIPISALSADQLETRGITEIKNIENITPNLSFLNSGVARGTAQVFLRGIGQVNWGPTQDPKVGVYVDGVYLGRPQGAIFDLLDIERVEVLRGPQGTLFGRNTTAGLVHVITRKPDATFDAKLSGGFGNDGQLNADALVNVPISDVLAARFALQARKADGFIKDDAGREWNSTDSQSLRASLLWTPTDTLEIRTSLEVFRARETSGLGDCEAVLGGPTGLNFIANIFGVFDDLERACAADDDPFTSNDNDPNDLEIDANSIAVTVNWDIGELTLTSITAYRDMTELNESWGWGTDFFGGPSFSLEVLADQTSPYDQWSQEFRVGGIAFDDRMTWITGLYGFRESATQRLHVPFWRGVMPPTDPAEAPLFFLPCALIGVPGCNTLGDLAVATQTAVSRRQETHATNTSWAVFAEATFDLTERLAVTAGYRWTKDTREFKRFQFTSNFGFDVGNLCPGMPLDANGLATRSSCTQEVSYNESTPRVIFNYDVNDDVMLYLGFSRGYSAGGMNGDIRMRPFLPEVSDNWEGGIKSRWFDNRLQVNLTLFQNDYENQQITVGRLVRGQPTADLINAQEATIEGIEIEVQTTPAEGWFVTGSYGYLDGEYDEFSTIDTTFDPVTLEETEFVNDFSDTEFVGGAPETYSVSVLKEFYTDTAGTIAAQIGWSFRGRTYNSLERRKRSRQGKYGLLDARIRWELPNGRTSVSLWGTNLGDRKYYRAAQDLPDLGVLLKYYSEPRRYGLTVTHSMGE